MNTLSVNTEQIQDNTLYILDVYGLIYRSYFAFVNRPLTNSAGENVSAVYGFFRTLHTILQTYQPQFFLAAFDSKTPTFRHELYPEYKATREKTPEDLHAQIPHIEHILTVLGIPLVRADGFEADDIIAAAVSRAEREKRPCVIISNDKDLMQLVTETVTMLKPDKTESRIQCGIEQVTEQWGVPPEQMLDLLSLIGDTADNVPGVKGIGPKTAVKLLKEYTTLEALYEQIDSVKGAVRQKLIAGKESAFFSKQLIRLNTAVPLPEDTYRCASLHYQAAADLFQQHGLRRLAELYGAFDTGGSHRQHSSTDAAIESGSNAAEAGGSGTARMEADTGLVSFLKQLEHAAPPVQNNSGDYRIITDEAALNLLIDQAITQGYAAFDCETTGLNPFTDTLVGFSLSVSAGSAVYVPLKAPAQDLLELAQTDNSSASVMPKAAAMPKVAAYRALKRLLSNKTLTLILHNGKFDYQVMQSAGITDMHCTLFDTMIAAWLLDPDYYSFGLEHLAEVLLGLHGISYNEVVPKGKTFADVPLEKAAVYAAEDADLTLQLYLLLLPVLQKSGLYTLFQTVEMPLMPLLARMEAQGIFLKKEDLGAFSCELAALLETQQADIFRIAGHPFNIASPKQLQEVLFTERKLPAGKKTKTGYSTDLSVLEELSALDELPAKILEYRVSSKLKSTYTDALPLLTDSNGRIHTSFIQTGTATGRLSSRDPNLQNIPIRGEEGRKIRGAFYAAEGHQLISADYAQIELVILAHLSGDSNLVTAFQHGIDVHTATASLIFETPAESVVPDMRRIAKVINFGIMYGMSAFRLANQLRISRTDAAEFIKRYFATYSGVAAFIEDLKAAAARDGFVTTLMGRKRMIAGIDSSNKTRRAAAERIAVNTPIQGSAADIVKTAMLKVDTALRAEQLSARLLLQVHDELILEAPQHEVETVKALLQREMESVITLKVPLRVSIESGNSWGCFH
ncbi:MAG: DNA polymerase I [Treponema sp.]